MPSRADYQNSKHHHHQIVWNRVISIEGVRHICLDVGEFYLQTPSQKYEYMKIPVALFLSWTGNQYNLNKNAHNGFVYWGICKAIYGLPNAGRLANERIRQKLKLTGFCEVAHTPGLWKHKQCPVLYSLVVDKVWVKYVAKDHID
jgi:hypothetical protein